MSHVCVMDVPTYPRPLFITDSALNLAAKRDIVQNAINLALAIGVESPKVAILSAVETVNPTLRSSWTRRRWPRWQSAARSAAGLVDGPLAFDSTVSPAAVRVKGITSPVAGQADIVVAPNLVSGAMLVKQLDSLCDAQATGIVLGARVPIVLTSRADSAFERMASCALAVLTKRTPKRGMPTPDEDARTARPVRAALSRAIEGRGGGLHG